jgi:hypothetical protein
MQPRWNNETSSELSRERRPGLEDMNYAEIVVATMVAVSAPLLTLGLLLGELW